MGDLAGEGLARPPAREARAPPGPRRAARRRGRRAAAGAVRPRRRPPRRPPPPVRRRPVPPVHGVRARHGDVESAAQCAGGGAGGEPVGDGDAVEAPLAAQHVVLEVPVLGHGDAVDLVVRGHDGPGAGVADDPLEGAEVELAQRSGRDDVVDGEAVGLGVVGDEVLDAGRDAAVLDAEDVAGPDLAGEVRILAVRLEVATAQRRAVQVHRRGEQHVDALAAGLGGERAARPAGESGVPGGGERGGGRQGEGGVVGGPAHAPHADGPVGQHQGGESGGGGGGEAPHVLAARSRALCPGRACGARRRPPRRAAPRGPAIPGPASRGARSGRSSFRTVPDPPPGRSSRPRLRSGPPPGRSSRPRLRSDPPPGRSLPRRLRPGPPPGRWRGPRVRSGPPSRRPILRARSPPVRARRCPPCQPPWPPPASRPSVGAHRGPWTG